MENPRKARIRTKERKPMMAPMIPNVLRLGVGVDEEDGSDDGVGGSTVVDELPIPFEMDVVLGAGTTLDAEEEKVVEAVVMMDEYVERYALFDRYSFRIILDYAG
ncbi:12188_t:CDS:1 [Acaulospora colombiana]|uniref:12188_t:CDS:1 n=1 Tax=Acaulospora colombiana TaxID=27376 RepID=A0ACA9M9T7_9GLOM|nr:12188_t:CDS:1 [Acaulospora colombiana]